VSEAGEAIIDDIITKHVHDPSTPILAGRVITCLVCLLTGAFSRSGIAVRALALVETPMHGRRVLITGATGGIGLAAATGLVRLGAELVLGAISGRWKRR
jgi:hypothetical protein